MVGQGGAAARLRVEAVPGVAAAVEDGVEIGAAAAREEALPQVRPDALDRVQGRAAGRQEDQADGGRGGDAGGDAPSGAVEQPRCARALRQGRSGKAAAQRSRKTCRAAAPASVMASAQARSAPGRTAPQSRAGAWRWSMMPSGRTPRSNRTLAPRPFWPARAASWRRSRASASGRLRAIARSAAARPPCCSAPAPPCRPRGGAAGSSATRGRAPSPAAACRLRGGRRRSAPRRSGTGQRRARRRRARRTRRRAPGRARAAGWLCMPPAAPPPSGSDGRGGAGRAGRPRPRRCSGPPGPAAFAGPARRQGPPPRGPGRPARWRARSAAPRDQPRRNTPVPLSARQPTQLRRLHVRPDRRRRAHPVPSAKVGKHRITPPQAMPHADEPAVHEPGIILASGSPDLLWGSPHALLCLDHDRSRRRCKDWDFAGRV